MLFENWYFFTTASHLYQQQSASLRISGQWEKSGWKWLVSGSSERRTNYSTDNPAHRSQKIHGGTTHYALTRVRKKTNNFSDFCFFLQTEDIWRRRIKSEKLCLLEDSINNVQWVPVVLCWGELLVCTKLRVASFYCAMSPYCWHSLSTFQHAFRRLMKVTERHGVSEHQKQLGTSLHCTRTCTSGNWFSIARHTDMPPCRKCLPDRTVKSAYGTNLLSHQNSMEH